MSGRCVSCNKILNEIEMCRKRLDTGEYFDLCTRCLKEVVDMVDIPINGELYEDGNEEFFDEEQPIDTDTREW